jgi:hypothetical protein
MNIKNFEEKYNDLQEEFKEALTWDNEGEEPNPVSFNFLQTLGKINVYEFVEDFILVVDEEVQGVIEDWSVKTPEEYLDDWKEFFLELDDAMREEQEDEGTC